MGKLTKKELIDIAFNYSLRYKGKSDFYHYADNEEMDTRNRLITLICYLSGKYSFVNCTNDEIKKLGDERLAFLKNIGTQKPFAKKLISLMKIFNTYCELKPVTDKPNEKSEPRIKYYLVDGKIPEVLGNIIDKTFIDYKVEDELIKDEMIKKIQLKDDTTKKLFNNLIK